MVGFFVVLSRFREAGQYFEVRPSLKLRRDGNRPPVRRPVRSTMAPSASLAGPTTLRVAVDEAERSTLLACLQRSGGSRKRAAEELGVNRTTLFNKMRKHGLMETVFDPTVEERAPQPPPRPSP